MSLQISLEDLENIFNRIEELMNERLQSDAVACAYRQAWQQAVMEQMARSTIDLPEASLVEKQEVFAEMPYPGGNGNYPDGFNPQLYGL